MVTWEVRNKLLSWARKNEKKIIDRNRKLYHRDEKENSIDWETSGSESFLGSAVGK